MAGEVCICRFFAGGGLHLLNVQIIQNRRLQSAEAEIVRAILNVRPRKSNRVRIALLCKGVHLRTAGVAEADGAGNLVIRLPRSVVVSAADDAVRSVVLHHDDVGVPAGHNKAQKRRLQVGMGNVIGRHMPLDVMHADEGLGRGKCNRLRLRNAHKQRPDQAGAVRNRDGVHIRKGHLRCGQSLGNHGIDLLDVLSRGNLRHHTAVERVQRNLRRDHVGENLAPVLYNSRCGLIARGFDCQNVSTFHIVTRIA